MKSLPLYVKLSCFAFQLLKDLLYLSSTSRNWSLSEESSTKFREDKAINADNSRNTKDCVLDLELNSSANVTVFVLPGRSGFEFVIAAKSRLELNKSHGEMLWKSVSFSSILNK